MFRKGLQLRAHSKNIQETGELQKSKVKARVRTLDNAPLGLKEMTFSESPMSEDRLGQKRLLTEVIVVHGSMIQGVLFLYFYQVMFTMLT